jgi:hypothetical protein
MLPKLATLVKSKTAIAVLGVVLVGGSGGAVAMAATTGHLAPLGVDLGASTDQTKTPEKAETPDSHAHTTSVEGLLAACDTSATPNTISVTDKAGKSWTFVITTTTKFNGDTQSESSAKGDNSAHTGGASTGDHSGGASTGGASTGGASTGDSSAHVAPTLADVCATANIGARDVEVQATADTTDSTKLDAWKVTLQGPASSKNDGQSGDSTDHSGAGSSTGGSSEGSQSTPEARQYDGTVTAVSATGFTMTHNGVSYDVTVSATTHFSGGASLSTLQVNAHVSVGGTLSGTSITATYVEVDN